MSTAEIIAAFVVSTVGFSLFLYGKKQVRLPQLVAGMLMMVAPIAVRDPLWVTIGGIALLLGMRVAIRCES